MLNFRHLEVFHAVYTSGSVSAAARTLNVAQPTVSKVLRHAESAAGFALFHRSGGKLVPTEGAHSLFHEVVDIHERMSSLRQMTRNIGQRANGRIRLAVLPGFGLEVAPRAVAAFRREHPNVTFDIQTRHTADFTRSLQEFECDMVIGYEAPTHSSLAHSEVGEGELGLLFRRGDLPQVKERANLSLLQDQPFITIAADSGPLGKLLAGALDRLDVRPEKVMSISTSYIAVPLVRAGVGITVVDDLTARSLGAKDLEFRRFDPPLKFPLFCITLAARPLSRIAAMFVRALRDDLMTSTQPS